LAENGTTAVQAVHGVPETAPRTKHSALLDLDDGLRHVDLVLVHD